MSAALILLREYIRVLVENSHVEPLTSDVFRYASNAETPEYCIRFVDDPTHGPDAERKGEHTIVINGVYAFPALRKYLDDIIINAEPPTEFDAKRFERDLTAFRIAMARRWQLDDEEGWEKYLSQGGKTPYADDYASSGVKLSSNLHRYLEDCGLSGADYLFVMKVTAKKPYVIRTRADLNRVEAWGHLSNDERGKVKLGADHSHYDNANMQQTFISEGYDAIFDPHDFIDNGNMSQVCFLTNSAFQIVKCYKLGRVNYDKLRMSIEKTSEFKAIEARVKSAVEHHIENELSRRP